jgi:hypothetical protein
MIHSISAAMKIRVFLHQLQDRTPLYLKRRILSSLVLSLLCIYSVLGGKIFFHIN